MENLQEQIQQAKGLERAQKNDAALDIFLSLSQKPGPHTEDPAFWLRLGDVGHRVRRTEVAADAYPRAIDLLQRGHHGNSALAVARRLARATPDSAEVHVRLADLAASLGYARDASDAALRAADLAADGAQREAAVQSLRAAWTVLERDGLKKDAERVRSRVMELRPDADPLGDAGLVPPARPSAAPEDLGLERGTELSDPPPEPGLEPTAMDEADAGPEIERLDGLELTSAGRDADWGAPAGDPHTAADVAEEPELPGHPDLPLLGVEPDVSDAAPPARHPPEPDVPAPPSSLVADTGAANDAAEVEADELEAEEVETGTGSEADSDDRLPLLDSGADAVARRPAPESAPGRGAEPIRKAEPRPPTPAPPSQAGAEPALPEAVGKPEPERGKPAEPERRSRAEPKRSPGAADSDEEYVDLGALVMSDDEEEEEGTRFQMDAAQHPSGDEDRDFAEILGMFRQKVSENIHPQDSSSHYDLGLAFKEMGLFDDAIAQLQLALRAGANPVATLEVLGECFIEKGEHSLAVRVLGRALRIPEATESDLVGVLYWLGRTEEVLERPEDARGYYERVIGVDIGFRDAAARLQSLRGGSASSR